MALKPFRPLSPNLRFDGKPEAAPVLPPRPTIVRRSFRKQSRMPSPILDDDRIPIPERPPHPLAVYPWRQLAVSGSFLIPWPRPLCEMQPREKRALQVHVGAMVHFQNCRKTGRHTLPRKFTQRSMEYGIRVWRTQ
jgi:hypothetical protein